MRYLFSLLVVLCLAFATHPSAWGGPNDSAPDPEPPPYPWELPWGSLSKPSLVSKDTIQPSDGLGYLSIQSEVTPTGQFAWSHSIQVPAARAGMGPQLAITYGSDGGNDLLGVGIGLTGFSEINRCVGSPGTELEFAL